MNELLEVLRAAGPWGAPGVVIGYLYAKGHLATGRELSQLKSAYQDLIKERERERGELRDEIKFWREQAWSLARVAERTTDAIPAGKG